MSLTNLNEFPIHNISLNLNINTLQSTFLIVGLIKIFLLLQILLHRKRIFQSHDDHATEKKTDEYSEPSDRDDQSVCMETVLKSLGIFRQGDQVPTRMDAEEIFDIFEERRPCLDEVREAFEVFDGNRDGVIDEKELQKVLCDLGLKEGLEMENCRRMIAAFDENGDGRIDFDEFVKFMENSFT
ncbi:hypothetical protein ACS0TY_028388 [Phlomoides rotata]